MIVTIISDPPIAASSGSAPNPNLFPISDQQGEQEDTLLECNICGGKKGMVYLLADWGMGDIETRNQSYVEQNNDLSLREQQQQQQHPHPDKYDEVDLHPLSNQVSIKCRGKNPIIILWPVYIAIYTILFKFISNTKQTSLDRIRKFPAKYSTG